MVLKQNGEKSTPRPLVSQRPDPCEFIVPAQDFLQDGRGYTYQSVRTCELERFSTK